MLRGRDETVILLAHEQSNPRRWSVYDDIGRQHFGPRDKKTAKPFKLADEKANICLYTTSQKLEYFNHVALCICIWSHTSLPSSCRRSG